MARKLYHCGLIDPAAGKDLEAKGWEIVDVRLLPHDSDAECRQAVKAYLEGVRFGTIEIGNLTDLKALELEAKIYQLTSGREPSVEKQDDLKDASIDELLDFGRGRWDSTLRGEKK